MTMKSSRAEFAGLLIVAAGVLAVAYWILGEGRDKEERARRAACASNLKQVASAIRQHHQLKGSYPANLSELNIRLPRCPSASKGQGDYIWLPEERMLTENPGNHDKTKLNLQHSPTVRHSVSVQ